MRISDWSSDVCSSDLADDLHRLDEIDRIIVMLLEPRRDREDIGIEDDVLGRETDAGEQLVGALANLDLAFHRVGLPDLVERHHDDRGAIGHARSEEHTSELQSLMRISYAVFCL